MSSEYVAERLADSIGGWSDEIDVDALVDENVRSGGHWFTFTLRGRHYEVEVTEVTRR